MLSFSFLKLALLADSRSSVFVQLINSTGCGNFFVFYSFPIVGEPVGSSAKYGRDGGSKNKALIVFPTSLNVFPPVCPNEYISPGFLELIFVFLALVVLYMVT